MSTADTALPVLKTLADEVRLAIVRILASHPDGYSKGCDVSELCYERFKVSQPTMSHHLAKLVEAGVITERKDGTSKSYKLNYERLMSLGIDAKKL